MSEKKLQDYLHFYIGCQMMYSSHHEPQNESYVLTFKNIEEAIEFGDRPLLRRLEDMSDGEALELAKIYSGAEKVKRTTGTVSNFFYFFCDFKFGEKGISETLIIHKGEAWYQHYFETKKKRGRGHNIINIFDAFNYLIKCQFDLFSLIENSLAIDSATLHKIN